MIETWFTQLEHHISFGFIVVVSTAFLKNHRLIIRAKERLNVLWRDRCGITREGYTPVENGSPEVTPPVPAWFRR